MNFRYLAFAIVMSLGVLAAPPTFADLNDGLVAYYPFDGNAQDASNFRNNDREKGGIEKREELI